MTRSFITALTLLVTLSLSAQADNIIKGLLTDGESSIPFANVVVHSAQDSSMVKVDVSDENGVFSIQGLTDGTYYLEATYVGYTPMLVSDIRLGATERIVDLGTLTFNQTGVQLETATVTARRSIVEVKADRTVFNVEGTINAAGSDGLELLRKAPGVLVDNNENITVLGRSGVLLYVDGKRLPLTGDDLTAYLRSLDATQVDKIDIITSPGARYEAEGNAGIIDIRLRKLKDVGSNTMISLNASRGLETQSNINVNTNYRNGNWNLFGSVNAGDNTYVNSISFVNQQNDLLLNENNDFLRDQQQLGFRAGVDYSIDSKSTIGVLINGGDQMEDTDNRTRVGIAPQQSAQEVDSVLQATNVSDIRRRRMAYNLNYAYRHKDRTLNVDLDYGTFDNTNDLVQPNSYFTADGSTLLTRNEYFIQTPVTIDIYTATVDYEQPLAGGKLGFGGKFSNVVTDNRFLFNNVDGSETLFNDTRSNTFDYDEKVYAAYVNYAGSLSQKIKYSAGLRAEKTDALGDLGAFRPDLQSPPVELDYINFFPSGGITYTARPTSVYSLNYSRRINRPDYNVLNPFRNQISELTYQRGNASLNPEIVNSVEVGYLWKYMYNFKLAYTLTTDQITRLIGPDDIDKRASFISWDNLSTQRIISFNASAPIQFKTWWNAYFNFSMSHIDNQADYGDGAVVDVQAFSYNIYQQHTLTLGRGWTGEVSGWFSGPGVWGGVFRYDSSYSLNLGVQKKFFGDRLNVRISAQDVTFQSFWSGTTAFDGQVGTGRGNWDSRRVGANISYTFGKGKAQARKRKTGIEAEASRAGESSGR